ncbi:hypothetical protein ACKU3Z_029700 [Pseudomonas aeruginosa]|nr:hypothetical protein [Pseudomonas aeruginosa]
MAQNQQRKFYSVTADNKSWSRDAIAESDFLARGYSILESRLHGDFDLFYQGRLAAHLFINKQDAALHVQQYA